MGCAWMTFVDSGRQGQMFRHETGNWSHTEHVPESDTHKALKERKAATWSAAGARSVQTEEWRPKAKKRPDVFALGEKLTVAGEVQHTQITPSAVGRRQKALAASGDRVVWTTDRTADNVAWLRRGAAPGRARSGGLPAVPASRYTSTERGDGVDVLRSAAMRMG